MLIRWATKSDKPAWVLLAKNVAHIFGNLNMSTDIEFHEYMDAKLSKYEAIIAIDRMTNECSMEAQGCLFGKCHILSKVHSEHFYDMNPYDMANFMRDVQKAAKALHKVTGAVKINYEIHGNSVPHLHVHLFPRYLDDKFPSAPIDYRISEPSPYENHGEFQWFVEEMRNELKIEW